MFFVICVIFLSGLVSVQCSECRCQPQKTQFDTKYTDSVNETCNKCFSFSYHYFAEQNWTARVCIRSPSPGPTPLLVVARQSVSAITFSVPHSLKGDSSEFPSVCRILCPISNHLNTSFLNGTVQTILLDFWSHSPTQFEFEVQIVNDFIIGTSEPAVLNLTVAQPAVLQYNVPSDLETVRVEANSNTSECMILSVEDIECPFHDTHETIQQGGFRQTHTTKSAITIRKASSYEKIYIVMLLNPKDKDCKENEDSVEINHFKEVMVEITPVYETNMNLHVLWIPGLVIILMGMCCSYCYFCFSHVDDAIRIKNDKSTNISEIERETEEKYRQETVLLSDMLEKKPWSSKSYGYSWNLGIVAVFYGLPAIQLVYVSQNLVRKTGNLDTCYYNFLCSNTVELGSWVINDFNHVFSNIGYILLGIIFLLIVYNRERRDPESPWNIKKREPLHLTNRDVQSSGNENIQNEITGGDLTMLESSDFISDLVDHKKGIPPHYGLYYAMGWALIMEGVMSASYHICPKKANFQFDTTFMYVISMLCIMKLFYARHQAIAPKAYSVWIMLAFSIFLPFIGMFNEVAFWILFALWALTIYIFIFNVFLVPAKLDFSLRRKTCCFCLKKTRISPKSYANLILRAAMCINAAILCIEAVIGIGIYGFDFNTIILAFYIINLMVYVIFYIIIKEVWPFFVSRPKSFKEVIGSAKVWFLLFEVTAFVAMGYFVNNNVEWKKTPAESRERNSLCYSDYNYYDRHDVWHFVSSFSIFFLYLFLLTVDDDLAEKPVTNIIAF